MGTELIYSNSIDGNPYTLSYEYTRGINKDESETKSLKGKYKHRYFLDTDIKNFGITYEQFDNGRYYEEKEKSI